MKWTRQKILKFLVINLAMDNAIIKLIGINEYFRSGMTASKEVVVFVA